MPLWWMLWLVFLAIVGGARYRAVSAEASQRPSKSKRRRPAPAAPRQAQHYKAKRKAKRK